MTSGDPDGTGAGAGGLGDPGEPGALAEPGPDALVEELERAQGLRFLGPGPVDAHVAHARGFAAGVNAPPARFLDLGSGGGVPGLVLASLWPSAAAVLLDAGERRSVFLREAVERLGLEPRVTVVWQRAEEAGRDATLRGSFDLVVARSFGPPAVTAECAAPFLRVGGRLVVSEPPAADSAPEGGPTSDDARHEPAGSSSVDPVRWPPGGLAVLGLRLDVSWRSPFSYQALLQGEPCPDRYPRRVGQVAKRPLF